MKGFKKYKTKPRQIQAFCFDGSIESFLKISDLNICYNVTYNYIITDNQKNWPAAEPQTRVKTYTADKHLRRLDVDTAVRALPPYSNNIGEDKWNFRKKL